MTVVLDASAVLAVILDEPGKTRVLERWQEALIAPPNLAETLTVLVDRGHSPEKLAATRAVLRPNVSGFGAAEAELAGELRAATRHLGLSLGDRCCLALGILRQATVMTADRTWGKLDLGIAVELIR